MESPVHSERCSPGSGRGLWKPPRRNASRRPSLDRRQRPTFMGFGAGAAQSGYCWAPLTSGNPLSYTFPFPMPLDHERLEVYQVALEFFDLIDDIIEHLPRGRGHL